MNRTEEMRQQVTDFHKQHPEVWWTTREELATWYLQHHAQHIG